MSEITSFNGTAAEYIASKARQAGYEGTWPQASDHQPPVFIRGIAQRYPFRATLPVAPMSTLGKAMKATGNRLAVTEASDPAQMWIWARISLDASLASRAMASLTFEAHDGMGER